MAGELILVVDDTPHNVKRLADILGARGYAVSTASSGKEALEKVAAEPPDIVLLDVVMPEMSGYEVCRAIRNTPETARLPVVMVTALDPGQERIKGIEAGADDFLTKPINQPELLARVRSHLRIKELWDELSLLNQTLEARVAEQVAQLDRLGKLKRFFSPQLAEMGKLVVAAEATLERFTGDGMMIFFNDPVPVPNPAERAVRMAAAMRERVAELAVGWKKAGFDLDFGLGIAHGYATIGAIGFEGRVDYGAIGTVTNLAARLCSEAKPGQVLLERRVMTAVEAIAEAEPVGDVTLKGISRPVKIYNLLSLKSSP